MLPESPPHTENSRKASWRWRLARLLAVTAVLTAVTVLLRWLAPASVPARLATLYTVIWLQALGLPLLFWLWRKLTYRVGVRLFLSYLIIGVLPFVLMASLGAVMAFLAAGQYTSVRFGSLLDRTYESLGKLAEASLSEPLATVGEVVAREAARLQPSLPTCEWVARDGVQWAKSSRFTALPLPEEALVQDWTGPLVIEGTPWLAAARTKGGRWSVVMVSMRDAARAAAREAGWFEVNVTTFVEQESKEGGVRVEASKVEDPFQSSATEEASETVAASRGWLYRRFVLWPRLSERPLLWPTGTPLVGKRYAAMLLTSPAEAWADFMRAPYRLADDVLAGLAGLALFFAVVYAAVVSFAVTMIVSIANSTARLTRGAKAVAAGDLSARIPVKRRDQLGDLAVAFNTMTAAVERMLREVAESERLRREMELAREIQQSLLPATELVHKGVAVCAHFLPAAEVGGDYFDVFPLASGEVVVTVGDVAGHGVSTGLLMAMVKSAMGTLVLEGYRGGELVKRLNRLVLQQSVKHRMATLVVAQITPSAGEAELTSCGHPPALLVRPAGEVEEIVLSSLPLGTRLSLEPACRRLSFPPGSKLVLYSDGLLEATNPEGHALGAEGLAALVRRHARQPATQIVVGLLAGLREHVGERPLADDLTILVVEHSVPVSAAAT